MATYRIEGMRELEKAIKKLESLPQKVVTTAARKGMNISLKAAKRKAPVDTGLLKKGIMLKGERRTVPGKKVYDVMMNPALTDLFRRTTRDGSRRKGGAGKQSDRRVKGSYYYPASQEFGFQAVNGRYIPGFAYLKKSLTENNSVIEKKIVSEMTKEIDKL